MRKRRIKLLNNKYIIAYHIKLIKEQRYFTYPWLNTTVLDNRLTDGGEVVSPTLRPPFTPGIFLVLISVRG
jgi:hypothetical protein